MNLDIEPVETARSRALDRPDASAGIVAAGPACRGLLVSVYLHPGTAGPMPECAGTPGRRAADAMPDHLRALATPMRRSRHRRSASGTSQARRGCAAVAPATGAQAADAGRAPRADPADAGHDARAARGRAHHHRGAGRAAVGQRSRAVPPLRQQGADVRGADRVHRIERLHAGQPDHRARRRCGPSRRSASSPCCCSSARRTRA